jgi:hypothetical protein
MPVISQGGSKVERRELAQADPPPVFGTLVGWQPGTYRVGRPSRQEGTIPLFPASCLPASCPTWSRAGLSCARLQGGRERER